MKRTACLDLPNKEQISFLARKYDPLDFAPNLRILLKSVYSNVDFAEFSKVELHKLLNDVLLHWKYGEQSLKYELFKYAAKKKDVVAAFEIPVNNSRVDFLMVNGITTSYEIKSDLDNLDKLAKQAADYSMAFEYNYVVIQDKHLDKVVKILPKDFGILCFRAGKRIEHRKPLLNNKMDPRIQLDLLAKKELGKAFSRLFEVESILNTFSDSEINTRFKKSLKDRYRERWEFLLANEDAIMPIDLQFFFAKNILPGYVYQIG